MKIKIAACYACKLTMAYSAANSLKHTKCCINKSAARSIKRQQVVRVLQKRNTNVLSYSSFKRQLNLQ